MSYLTRAEAGQKTHIHALIRERFEDRDGTYLYRCISCNVRLKRKSGVIVDAAPAIAPAAEGTR